MDALKIGARNSRQDGERLQTIHDYAVENGAVCKQEPAEEKAIELVSYGTEVKALDGGKVAGYLVTFGGRDLTDEYFDASTDFGEVTRLPVLYHHGMDGTLKRRRIGTGDIKRDEVGLWVEAQLEMRDEYERKVYEMAKAGKLGWSSGTAQHVTQKSRDGRIEQWFLTEASLTPTPAEPKNMVVSLKSLMSVNDTATPDNPIAEAEVMAQAGNDGGAENNSQGVSKMSDITVTQEQLQQIAKEAADNAVKAYRESEPPINTAGINVTADESDRALDGNPFKSVGEFAMAVKTAGQYPSQTDKRLMPLKANGLNEAIPSQGGFLIPPQMAAGIIEPMYETGTLLNLFNPQPIQGNSMVYNVVDESSRADGSRWGGIQGYWMAEAGTKTASKPAFRQVEVKLNKVAALCVATDELLEDATALGGWIQRTVPQELRFKVEDAFINGNGVGKPLGIMNSGALKASGVHTGATTSIVNSVDIGAMWGARAVEYKDYVWLVNPRMFSNLLNLTIGQMPVFIPQGSLTNLPYGTLLGRPIYEVEYMPALASQGDIMLVSPSAYLSVQKAGGVQAASSIHLYFSTDESAFRFVYRVGGAPSWSSTRTEKDGTTVSPFVVMTATT